MKFMIVCVSFMLLELSEFVISENYMALDSFANEITEDYCPPTPQRKSPKFSVFGFLNMIVLTTVTVSNVLNVIVNNNNNNNNDNNNNDNNNNNNDASLNIIMNDDARRLRALEFKKQYDTLFSRQKINICKC